MKYSASIVTALACSALMVPSVMAEDAKKEDKKDLPLPTIANMKETWSKVTGADAAEKAKNFVGDVTKSYSLGQKDEEAIGKLDQDLYSYSFYTKGDDNKDLAVEKVIPSDAWYDAHRALLCQLVNTDAYLKEDKTIDVSKFDDILFKASLTGQVKNSSSPLQKHVPTGLGDGATKEQKAAAEKTEKQFGLFCHHLTTSHGQFLFANSSILHDNDPKSANAHQQKLLLTVLEVCKGHLGDARTLAASVGATFAATAVFLAAFL